ncbi:metallophosphoesterase [Succinimonas sp.]|uniref:metallophosphoesterase n=1 Tax=Succinimonas sp. TaxID=1936151 RepID=UPI003867A037
MNLYFTSDHHFGHTNIIKYAGRPFEWSDEGALACAEYMRDRYQATVQEDDVVVFLGDVALTRAATKQYYIDLISSLKGTRFLVKGNHDTQPVNFYRSCGFTDIRTYHIVGRHFICHYPCASEEYYPKESEFKKICDGAGCREIWHGHIHEKPSTETPDGMIRHNVCVDYAPNDFLPVLITDPELRSYFFKRAERFR